MIPIPYEQTFSACICLALLILAIMWLREELRARPRDWSVVKEKLYICDKCHYSFLAEHDEEHITRCPRCNEMCFIRKRKRF